MIVTARSHCSGPCIKRELERVAKAADEVRVEAGRVVVEQGHSGHECYVIIAGEAAVTLERLVHRHVRAG